MHCNTTFNYRITIYFLRRVHSKLLTQRVRTTFDFNLSSTSTGSLSLIATFAGRTKPYTLKYSEWGLHISLFSCNPSQGHRGTWHWNLVYKSILRLFTNCAQSSCSQKSCDSATDELPGTSTKRSTEHHTSMHQLSAVLLANSSEEPAQDSPWRHGWWPHTSGDSDMGSHSGSHQCSQSHMAAKQIWHESQDLHVQVVCSLITLILAFLFILSLIT